MTNAIAGLKGRLKQFDSTIAGKDGHGGADRVRYKYRNYDDLCRKLFVSVVSFKCTAGSNQPEDLRAKRKVAKFEYDCLAHYAERFGSLPEFNDKAASPKYSKIIGKGS